MPKRVSLAVAGAGLILVGAQSFATGQVQPAGASRKSPAQESAGQGCVKSCPRDDNPCDPPTIKKQDGRCTTMH